VGAKKRPRVTYVRRDTRGRRICVEAHEEEDGTRNTDGGVDAICPVHEKGVGEEPILHGEFVLEVSCS
jgi:hypothetical protein